MPLTSIERLLQQAQTDWPEGLAVATADPRSADHPLYPVEEAAVARAVVTRRAEFAAGRAAARAALSQLGLPEGPVPMAEDRSPVWPASVTGSLSHTTEACIAVAARRNEIRAVGVDIETDAPLAPDLASEIAQAEEIRRFGGSPGLAARRIFSLKEAAYKAQYALSRTLLGFDALILVDERGTLAFRDAVPPFAAGDRLSVRQWIADEMILSLCVLR
ncbi:4'-phosphopantetheinyl transferase family protein [Litorisediminicola beolgyonensis]|uniref:Enterobactin synthase component D n=1 Tax=Litorisediminicola beolgyonensis TaxID=1173614 RepID=A0ABW3ZHT4_9RHOB